MNRDSATSTTAIPFAAAVLARSERRTGDRRSAARVAQAWMRAAHSEDEALGAHARRELIATCRETRNLPEIRKAYHALIDGFAHRSSECGAAEYDLAVLLSEAWQRGDALAGDEALVHFHRAAALLAATGDNALIARLQTDRAIHEFALGDTSSTVMSLEGALHRWRLLGNDAQIAETLLTLGDCLDAAEHSGAAIRRYREAEAHFHALGDSLSANAAAVRAELVAHRISGSGSVIDLRQPR